MNDITDFFGEPISVYTSVQAEADGILVKIDHQLINYITASVFEKCIRPFVKEDGDEKILVKKLIDIAIVEMKKIYIKRGKKEEWFYSFQIKDVKFFCAQNETGKFTLMLPSDY